jgi:hypothetical protein
MDDSIFVSEHTAHGAKIGVTDDPIVNLHLGDVTDEVVVQVGCDPRMREAGAASDCTPPVVVTSAIPSAKSSSKPVDFVRLKTATWTKPFLEVEAVEAMVLSGFPVPANNFPLAFRRGPKSSVTPTFLPLTKPAPS